MRLLEDGFLHGELTEVEPSIDLRYGMDAVLSLLFVKEYLEVLLLDEKF